MAETAYTDVTAAPAPVRRRKESYPSSASLMDLIIHRQASLRLRGNCER